MKNNTPSIKNSISRYGLLGTLLFSFLIGGFLTQAIEKQFNDQFNLAFETKLRTIATLIEQEKGELDFEFSDIMMPEFKAKIDPEYFEIWSSNGVLLEKSNSLGKDQLPRVDIDLGTLDYRDVRLPDGSPGRLVAWHFLPVVEDDEKEYKNIKIEISDNNIRIGDNSYQRYSVTLVLAKSRTPLIKSITEVRWIIVISFLLLMILLYLVMRVVTALGLRPLNALSDQVNAIDTSSLNKQIPMASIHLELAGITEQINRMLNRVNDAFVREKRFSANVAHELSTPVSELKSLSAIGVISFDDPDLIVQFFKDVEDVAENMHQIIETLHILTQVKRNRVDKHLSTMSANKCIQNAIKCAQLNHVGKDIEIEWNSQQTKSINIYSDKYKFTQILINLLSNAIKYRELGTSLQIESDFEDGAFSIRISNFTDSLTQEDLDHLTEPFWRKDESRSGGVNTGLGLSLVNSLCEILDISFDFYLLATNQFVVKLDNIPMKEEKSVEALGIVD